MWLRSLPPGEDQTVNSLPQEYVRALFDTAQSANVAHSKLAEGLQGGGRTGLGQLLGND